MKIECFTEASLLGPALAGWEALVEAAGVPACSGALLAAWYRHLCPADAEPRVWLAREQGDVVGVLPLVAMPLRDGVQVQPAGQGAIYGVGPLTAQGREPEVAAAMAKAVARSGEEIDLVRLDGLSAGSAWPTAMRSALTAKGWQEVETGALTTSVVDLGEGVAAWWERRDRELRRRVRRRRWRLEEAGFVDRSYEAGPDVVERLAAVQALYLRRKDSRGGAGYDFGPAFVAMIADTVEARPGRIRLQTIESDEAVIAAQLVLQAGSTALMWITAFDADWGHLGPGIEVTRCAIAAGEGTVDVVDLSIGEFGYKGDLRDRQVPVGSMMWCRPELRRLAFAFAASSGVE